MAHQGREAHQDLEHLDQAAHQDSEHRVAEDQDLAEVAAVLELPELLVKVVLEVSLVSQKEPSAKSSNKGRCPASAAQWCHAVTAQPLSVFAEVLQFKTLPTRLAPMQVS